MSRKRRLTPRAALSARELDRVQAIVLGLYMLTGRPQPGRMRRLRDGLTRVLGMLQRAESR